MDACLTGSTCLILFSLLVETIALSSLQEKHAREELKGKNPENHFDLPAESHDGKLLDTNLRINYYDVEMTGAKPALCGDYSTLVLPSYSVRESQSIGTQILHKLYYQNTREVYTHDECNHQCFYGCRPAGYDEIIIDELIERDIPDLLIYQCERYHLIF
ncbi:unnamed protein product [Thelazia callipaeda]|uniref:CX domain-containing protein n=1 Tax=Thelazia callipaeda TaxID=103827 RepID=A0A0N5D7E8_THECL|nr:unnamed protein product [Thelazia callipaeda]